MEDPYPNLVLPQTKACSTIIRSFCCIGLSSASCIAAGAVANTIRTAATYIRNPVKTLLQRWRASFAYTGTTLPMSVTTIFHPCELSSLQLVLTFSRAYSDSTRYQQYTQPSRRPLFISLTSSSLTRWARRRQCDASRYASAVCTK